MTYPIKVTKSPTSKLSSVDFNNIPFGEVFSDHMFVADYKDGEWTDLRIEPFSPISMLPSNLALHYGQSVFEGMKASVNKDGEVMFFRPREHAERINRSAERMCMPSIPEDLFLQALHTLVDCDRAWVPPVDGSALYIRPFMFARDEILGVKVSKTYTFIIFTGPVGPYYPKPVRLKVEKKYIRAAKGGVGEAKAAGNYGASMYPAYLAQQQGFDQILWLDAQHHEFIQEVGTMNIFFRINDTILTPETDGCILHGITRDSIIQILKKENVNLEIRPISIHEIVKAHNDGSLKEIFGCGTAAVVAYVSDFTIDDKTYKLPSQESGDNMAKYLKEKINGIRSGLYPDLYDWQVPVASPVTA